MPYRQRHQRQVHAFLEQHFCSRSWEYQLPPGHGNETYFARSPNGTYFVKLGAKASIYQAAASIGLTPRVLAVGFLEDGTSIIVQPYIIGKKPSGRDYHIHLEQFAAAIRQIHHSTEIRRILPNVSTNRFCIRGLQALSHLKEKWERYKSQVPQVVDFIDANLDRLEQQVKKFQGTGLVVSHNDMCNANWLISSDGQLYLIDLESMSLDDPALDLGATLWWYYPPRLRGTFLRRAGYLNATGLEKRMQVRMAMHCLDILLPRERSFDRFNPTFFAESLTDFRAILVGQENPEGYGR